MEIKNEVIVGYGEIGSSVDQVIGPCFIEDPKIGSVDSTEDISIMHICFPYSDTFVDDVQTYHKKYKPELTIIYSTVAVGTTKKLGEGFVHSPVEGKHPYLASSIMMFPRWMGSTDEIALKKAAERWAGSVNTIRMVKDSDWTEFLKLRSTSRFGINLAFARYEKSVADQIGMSWHDLMEFDQDYNNLYKDLNMPKMQRYVLTPPGDKIGGHCVVPNAELLNQQFPNPLLKEIK